MPKCPTTIATGADRDHTPVAPPPAYVFTRPLYVRKVPEAVWLRIHDNAHRSRMRIQDYVVRVLEDCKPFAF